MNANSTVWDVKCEIKKIDELCEKAHDLTSTECCVKCDSEEVTITVADLRAMELRLHDLKQMYLSSNVNLPICCRDGK